MQRTMMVITLAILLAGPVAQAKSVQSLPGLSLSPEQLHEQMVKQLRTEGALKSARTVGKFRVDYLIQGSGSCILIAFFGQRKVPIGGYRALSKMLAIVAVKSLVKAGHNPRTTGTRIFAAVFQASKSITEKVSMTHVASAAYDPGQDMVVDVTIYVSPSEYFRARK